jgi:hypothetical protein
MFTDFLRHECRFFIQTSPLHLTTSLMRLYTCLMDEISAQATAEGSDRMSGTQVYMTSTMYLGLKIDDFQKALRGNRWWWRGGGGLRTSFYQLNCDPAWNSVYIPPSLEFPRCQIPLENDLNRRPSPGFCSLITPPPGFLPLSSEDRPAFMIVFS